MAGLLKLQVLFLKRGYTFDYKNLTVTIVKADQFMTHEIRVEVHPQKENIED